MNSSGSYNVAINNTAPHPQGQTQKCGNISSLDNFTMEYKITSQHAAFRFNFTWSDAKMVSFLALRFNGEPSKTRNDLLFESDGKGKLRMEDSGLMTAIVIETSSTSAVFFIKERQLEINGVLSVLLKLGQYKLLVFNWYYAKVHCIVLQNCIYS